MTPRSSKKTPKTPFAKRLVKLIADEKNFMFEDKCGLTNGSVNRYLSGQSPKLEALQSICLATGCDANWLLLGKGKPFPD